MTRRLALALACAAVCATAASGSAQTVRGFVTDASTGGTLPGATVAVLRLDGAGTLRGASADGDGYYLVAGLSPGRYLARASYVGYLPVSDTLDVDGAVRWSPSLAPDEGRLGEVVVQGQAGGGAADVEGGLQRIRPADLAMIPTPDVAGDLASYLQALPGVVTLGDRGGGLYVRGGTPSQNLVLIDGAPVYQPFHAVGFFSAFPEDVVGSVDFYAGGFGARYTGRVSSVMDVTVREGNYESLEAAGSVGPFLVGARAEGPIRRGRSSWLVSARRSVVDAVADAVLSEPVPLDFADVVVKLSRADGPSRCGATGLYTWDKGALDSQADDAFLWSNAVLSGRCVISPEALVGRLEVSASVSTVGNEVGPRLGDRRERTSRATEARIAADLSRPVGPVNLRFGATSSYYRTTYDLSESFARARDDGEALLGGSAYAEVEVDLGGGLRVSPSAAVTLRPYAFAAGLEPRVRAVWAPAGASGPRASAAAGVYRQSLVGLVDERDAGSPFVAWAGPPFEAPETTARHLLVGGSVPVTPGLRVSAEGYVKSMSDLPVPIWSALAQFTTTLVPADVRSTGADVRAEWGGGPATLYLAYGYSRTTYSAVDGGDFGVWFGVPLQSYAPPHDRRHQVQAAGQYTVGRVDLSARWQVGSGLPYTRPFGFDTVTPPIGLPDVQRDPGHAARRVRAALQRPAADVPPARRVGRDRGAAGGGRARRPGRRRQHVRPRQRVLLRRLPGPARGPAPVRPLRLRQAPHAPMTPRPLALAAAALAALAGCEVALDPIEDGTRYFTLSGYLDTEADTQWVRVEPLDLTVAPSDEPIDAEVTLVGPGGRARFTQRVVRLGPNPSHLFWTTADVEPGQAYTVEARRPDGATTRARVRTPAPDPPPVLYDGFDECPARMTLASTQPVGDAFVTYRVAGAIPRTIRFDRLDKVFRFGDDWVLTAYYGSDAVEARLNPLDVRNPDLSAEMALAIVTDDWPEETDLETAPRPDRQPAGRGRARVRRRGDRVAAGVPAGRPADLVHRGRPVLRGRPDPPLAAAADR